jgi:putative membrane protein
MTNEKTEWLSRVPREDLSKKLGIVAWVLTAVVLGLVGLMRTVRIPLPEGMSFAFLPPVHAVLNSLVAVALVVAIVAIKRGKVRLHRSAIFAAMGFSIAFLLCYVAYHFTTEETRYGGTGAMKGVYFFLLITHIVLAGVSLPFILFTFISGWTNRFAAHRRLAKWVFPMWFYVAVTGPVCYLMLKPYYP